MKTKLLLLLILLTASIVFSQRLYKISVQISGREETLSYVTKAGMDYASAKELSSLLGVTQFFNADASKIEIKFKDYILKFTAKNQFVILNRKSDGEQSIFQIPISTLLIKEDVFIPIIYCVDYLSLGYGKKIFFDSRIKNLIVTNEPFAEESFVAAKQSPEETKQPETVTPAEKVNSKYDISSIEVEEKSNGTLIRLKASRKINIPKHSINNNILFVFIDQLFQVGADFLMVGDLELVENNTADQNHGHNGNGHTP